MASRVHNGSVHLERSGTDEAVCVSCERSLEAERCGHCGAASRAGRYRIRRVIAQGPSGRMYLAAEEAGAEVALKELVFALVPSIDAVEAFHREAALLRQLEHPRIPRYVESFTAGEGVHTRLYLAQQYVSGGSLLEDLNRGGTFEEPALALVAREALQILSHLHACKPPVLHRDLKPANLLRGPTGEVMLVDFGSARVHPRGATHGSTLVGTYGYMPPEQLGGTVDATSDLYALGASLVHLATGTPPADLLTRDLSLDLSGLGHLSPRLRTVIAKLVARDRAERFSSAREVLAALDGGALPRKGFRVPRWAVGAVAGALVLGGGVLFAIKARPPVQAPVESVHTLPAPGWERTVISRQKLSWQAHPRWVSALAFAGARLATAGVDGGLNVWDPDSGNLLSQMHGPLESVDAIALDRTGTWIATVTAGKSGFRVFEPFGKLTRVMTLEPIQAIAISPDALFVFAGGEGSTVHRYQTPSLFEVSPPLELGQSGGVTALAVNARFLVAGTGAPDASNRVVVFALGEGIRKVHELALHPGRVNALAISSDSRFLASSGEQATLVSSVAGGEPRELVGVGAAKALRFSPSGDLLAALGMDGRVTLWDTRQWRQLGDLGSSGPATAIAFSEDGTKLATGDREGKVTLWDVWELRGLR